MLLNVIFLSLYNDPKSWNAYFPLQILSLPFSILLSAPRRLTFYGPHQQASLPIGLFLDFANGRPQQDRGG